jgi:histidyl-tRNA synthetase
MGSNRPEADAEITMLTNSLMSSSGLKDYMFKVGHVGVLRGIFSQENLDEKVQDAVMQLMDKKQYDDALRMVEDNKASGKCMKILKELLELKGQEVFDVVARMQKLVEGYDEAVKATKNLCGILKLVSESGTKINMVVDAGFARGLEYYTGMIFEAYVPDLDIALGGGGRYDRLIELFGGEPTPAVGVAHGLDRIMLAMQEQKTLLEPSKEKSVVVISASESLRGETLRIAVLLRDAGIPAEVEVMGRRMAKALEDADRRKVDFAVIVGERELKEGAVVLRELKEREQSTIRIEKLIDTIKD